MDCVPHLMLTRGRVNVMSLRPPWPGQPQYPHHSCPYRISKTGEDMIIKEWKKCMVSHGEVLGSNIVQKARIGDMIISILHNGESGAILFFAILP